MAIFDDEDLGLEPDPGPLELVSTQDLIDELASRFDGLVMAGQQDLSLDDDATLFHMSGCLPLALGLVILLDARLRAMV